MKEQLVEWSDAKEQVDESVMTETREECVTEE